MATIKVKKVVSDSNQVGGLKTSRYEKCEVAFGKIPAASYSLNDTIVFADVRSYEVISAKIVALSDTPVVLDIYPGADLASALTLPVASKVDISYKIEFIRGTGKVTQVETGVTAFPKVGQELQITVVQGS